MTDGIFDKDVATDDTRSVNAGQIDVNRQTFTYDEAAHKKTVVAAIVAGVIAELTAVAGGFGLSFFAILILVGLVCLASESARRTCMHYRNTLNEERKNLLRMEHTLRITYESDNATKEYKLKKLAIALDSALDSYKALKQAYTALKDKTLNGSDNDKSGLDSVESVKDPFTDESDEGDDVSLDEADTPPSVIDGQPINNNNQP